MKSFLIILNVFCFFNIFSQDVFILNNGSEINVKLISINNQTIIYSENQNTKNIPKSDVFRITLQNGEKLLIKPETIYPPVVYEDMLIFTDGSDLSVKILDIEGESVKYIYENKENSIHASMIKFIKYKDGKTLKGIDLIKYEDKIILLNGEEIITLKYIESSSTHIIYQEKNISNTSQIAFNEVFVVKLTNGEKIFPPKEIITPQKTDNKILLPKDTTKIVELEKTKIDNTTQKPEFTETYGSLILQNGDEIKGNYQGIKANILYYINEHDQEAGIKVDLVNKVYDYKKNLIHIPELSQNMSNSKINNSNNKENNFKVKTNLVNNFNIGISNPILYSEDEALAYGGLNLDFCFRKKKWYESTIGPSYNSISNDFNIVRQFGIHSKHRFFPTKRFNFNIGAGIHYSPEFELLSTNIPIGLGWKGRIASFDFILYSPITLIGNLSTVNTSGIGISLGFNLYNKNKGIFKN